MKWTKKQLSILLVVSVTSFMGTFLLSSVNIALPAIERSFTLDAIGLSWVVSSFLLSMALFLLPSGKLGDMFGNGKLFKIGIIIFTIGSLFCALAPSGAWLIAARFFQGVGMAFSITTGQAILVAGFSVKNRGQVIGYSVAAVYAGLALGPFFGGILTQQMGWESLFYLSVVLGVVSIVIAFLFLEKDSVPTKEKVDFRGTLVFMLGLTAVVCGSSMTPASIGWWLILVGVLLIALFWMIEKRTTHPMIDTKLYTQNRLFAYSNMAALLNYMATFATIFFLSFYLQKIKALSPQQTGIVILVQPVVMALFSPIVGKLSDKIQPRYFATLGMGMCTMGLFSFSFLSATTPIWFIFAVLFWEGLGFALFSSPNMSTIMSAVDRTKFGLAAGSAGLMRVVGQIFGMIIITLFFAYFFEGKAIDAISDDVFLAAIDLGFLTFAVICFVGIYFSATRGDLERKKS